VLHCQRAGLISGMITIALQHKNSLTIYHFARNCVLCKLKSLGTTCCLVKSGVQQDKKDTSYEGLRFTAVLSVALCLAFQKRQVCALIPSGLTDVSVVFIRVSTSRRQKHVACPAFGTHSVRKLSGVLIVTFLRLSKQILEMSVA
jgi:hypothetical protein